MNRDQDQPPPSREPARRGEQTGKHDSRDCNDPEVQPGARKGRGEPPHVNPEPPRGRGQG